MSQRRGSAAIPARLPRTIVRLCRCYLFILVSLFFFFFSSICYSHLSYRLAPPAGHRVSERGLCRPGKTRWSQTNKKAKAPTPCVSQSGSCQGDIKGTPAMQSPKCLPFLFPPPCLHLSPPFKRYIVEMTEPSPNAPKILPPPLFPPSLFPSLVSAPGASPHGLGSL